MPESDLPQGTAADTALTFNQGVEDISNLISDPDEPDLSGDDQGPDDQDGAEADPDADAQQDDPDADGEDDGSQDAYSGGKFAAHNAKVRLEDGTVITVSELARNNLFQRDYTRKTTELKVEKETFDRQKAQVGEHAQAIAAQRDFLLQVAPRFLPQPPDRSMMDTDPLGYIQAKAEYDEKAQVLNQLHYAQQGEMQRRQEEQAQQLHARKTEEARKLVEVIPEFRDQKVYGQFWTDAVDTLGKFGFTPQEFEAVDDHRMYRVLHALVKYERALKPAPKVQQEVQAKPKLISGGKRMDPKSKISRERTGRAEQLRKTGTLDAGIAALMDLDL